MVPFFSIIIPVYNVAPYLRECLDSVLTQTFTDWEAICVDDGSTDDSGEILDEYAARDQRFRVFHQRNAGVSVARNKALDEARGEWIWFVDSDDRIKPYAMERFTSYESKADLNYFGMDFLYADGCVKTCKYKRIVKTRIDEISSKELVEMTRCAMGVDFFGYTWNKIFKREIISKMSIRFEINVSLWEDALFTLRFLSYADTFSVLPEILYEYRCLPTGLTNRRQKPFVETGIAFFKCADMVKHLPLRRFSAARGMRCFWRAYENGDRLRAAHKMIWLYREHDDLLEKNGRYMKLLAMCSRLPNWLGVPLLICANEMRHG